MYVFQSVSHYNIFKSLWRVIVSYFCSEIRKISNIPQCSYNLSPEEGPKIREILKIVTIAVFANTKHIYISVRKMYVCMYIYIYIYPLFFSLFFPVASLSVTLLCLTFSFFQYFLYLHLSIEHRIELCVCNSQARPRTTLRVYRGRSSYVLPSCVYTKSALTLPHLPLHSLLPTLNPLPHSLHPLHYTFNLNM